MSESRLSDRIRNGSAHVTIVGQGYVGLPLAVELAQAGFSVSGLDTNFERVAALNAGQSYTPDVDSEALRTLIRAGRYEATTDTDVLGLSDVIIICVPTPLRKSKDPDISYVVAAAEEVAKRFRPEQLVILESTTYPGTTEELLLPMFEERGARVGVDLFLAFSPERIDPANGKFSLPEIPKVVGGVTPACSQMAALLYGQIIDKVLEVSSPKVAELAKLYENTFRNVNIALANELALACRKIGVDPWEVIDAAATKPFGFMPFYPGPGIGGHCIPVDPLYLSWKIRLTGYEAQFIGLADQINRTMPEHVVTLVTDSLNERAKALRGSSVLVMGVTYKADVNDIRESPALEIVEMLIRKGARVSYADPFTPQLALDGHKLAAVAPTPEALAAADCVLILTNHSSFDYAAIADRASLVVDTRNALKRHRGSKTSIVTL